MKRILSIVMALFPVILLMGLTVSWVDGWPTLARWSVLGRSGIPVQEGLWTSAGVALAVAAISTILGAGTARAMQASRWRSVLMPLAWLPWAVSPVIAGILFMVVYLRAGIDGTVLSVVLAHLVFSGAYAVVLMDGFWRRDVARLEEIGRTLGASGRGLLVHVLWPAMRRPLMLVFAQTFLISWFQYGVTLLVGAGRVQTLPVLVFGFVGEANVYLAAMASLLLVIPPMLLLWVTRNEWTT